MNLQGKPFFLNEAQQEWVYKTLNSLSIEQKIHQMFCFLGDSTTEQNLENIVKNGIGGILFRPVRTKKEIREHFEKLEKMSQIPLLHAANLEEGGAGCASDGTYFSSQLGVAATNDLTHCKNFALACAKEGFDSSINWTFSPVSDIDFNFRNPITNCRTMGSDVQRVTDFTTQFVTTVQQCGMAACAKHFPGDGVDFRDQHLHPTYNSLSYNEWLNSYGKVYKSMIDSGLASVMVGHICAPNLSMHFNGNLQFADCLPASLSKEILTDLLRGELGFEGLITTDATIMGGFTMAMERRLAIPQVFNAGCDMIVFTTDLQEDFSYALQAVENGSLSIQRVDEAVTRILALKAKYCCPGKSVQIDVDKAQAQCVDAAITLVKNNAGILPINNKFKTIRLAMLGDDQTWDGSLQELMKTQLEQKGFIVELYQPFDDDLHGTANLPNDRLTITMLNYPPASNQTTVRVGWCPKHALEIPRFVNEENHIFISFANPYHLQDVPRTKVFINAYTATKKTVAAVCDKLCGQSDFIGVSPVDAFCGLQDAKL